jgi:hypothetical protein
MSCDKIPQTGIINNVTNGVTTTYKNLKPEEVLKVMNDEVVQHDQVVLGESLEVITNKVTGFTERDGRVSVGGELKVMDHSGKVLLHIDDLFDPERTFHRDSISFLRCTVSTGAPMKYNESYDVEIRYWDKFGDGEIVNEFTMEIIDVP